MGSRIKYDYDDGEDLDCSHVITGFFLLRECGCSPFPMFMPGRTGIVVPRFVYQRCEGHPGGAAAATPKVWGNN